MTSEQVPCWVLHLSAVNIFNISWQQDMTKQRRSVTEKDSSQLGIVSDESRQELWVSSLVLWEATMTGPTKTVEDGLEEDASAVSNGELWTLMQDQYECFD